MNPSVDGLGERERRLGKVIVTCLQAAGLVGHICPQYGASHVKGKRRRDPDNVERLQHQALLPTQPCP
jgi:hypothetical protein